MARATSLMFVVLGEHAITTGAFIRPETCFQICSQLAALTTCLIMPLSGAWTINAVLRPLVNRTTNTVFAELPSVADTYPYGQTAITVAGFDRL